ncbi:hypothetical protein [Myxococcus sp. AM010]|uniref:hypothetical protein n=1 Tax=Myxococcus sp. AM010 TaxID=2745138 RepID=UPI001595AF84|nr:hypothetical protein [Myxococcus sp. AM010]NVJ12972.1 hypothetical protein [Myxococcus sp. AM010]
MAGPFTTFVLSGLLAAAPGGFTFEGREASARTEQPDGFFIQGSLPFTDLAERGTGSASLTVEDRVSPPGATYGDKGTLEASFRLGATEFRVELTRPGFPPEQGQGGSGPLPRPPQHAIGGGVLLDVPLYGDSGLGWTAMTRTHAAVAVWGVGSVWRNGQLLTDTAFVHAAALAAGAYADDDTHRLLRQARYDDTELVVLVWNLPPRVEPRGFIQFVFEDVAIDVGGAAVSSRPFVENTGNPPLSWRSLTPVPPSATVGAPVTASPPPAPSASGGSGTAGLDGAARTGAVTRVPVPATAPGGLATTPVPTPAVPGAPVTPEVISGELPVPAVTNTPATYSGQLPVAPLDGTTVVVGAPGSGTATGAFATPPTSTFGSFTVQPLAPGSFDAFVGTGQSSAGIIATEPPLNSNPAVPLPGLLTTPAPLNAGPPAPLLGTPAPLNAAPALPLPATPSPVSGPATAGAPAAPATTGAPAAPAPAPAAPGP